MNNQNTTETSAVLDAREDVVGNCGKEFAQIRSKIFSSNATHYFLKDILNKCEQRDTLDNVKNLEVALRLMKLKLRAGW
jgi:hypothetical protein